MNFVDPLGLISRPNRSARPRPRSNRPVIYYHAGAAISDYKRRNQSSYINELNNAIVAPDTPISIYAQVFEQRAAQVYTSAISNSSSRVEAYRKMLSIANEADELRSIAKYIGNAGKIVGGFGTVITGVVNIHGSINNPLYNLEDMRKAIAIDVIATGISVAAIVLLPATTPLLVGLAIGAGISYGASALKEGLID